MRYGSSAYLDGAAICEAWGPISEPHRGTGLQRALAGLDAPARCGRCGGVQPGSNPRDKHHDRTRAGAVGLPRNHRRDWPILDVVGGFK